jgi:DNA-binding response OmpR family regulator
MAATRNVRISAPDDSLTRALSEHRTSRDGWRIGPLDGPPDEHGLVILDLDNPDESAMSLAALRAGGYEGPVLILGGLPGEGELDDEAIARPVRLGTLLARMDAHWAQTPDIAPAQLGPYEFVFADPVLRHTENGTSIRLTELERKLLAYLIDAKGGLVDRAQLLLRVWGYSAGVDTHTAETHIWRLRQKIETDDPRTRFLVTEPGGYRLISKT